MISKHKRDLEDALAKKEKELMTDYALDKMNSSPPDPSAQLEENISELEKEIKFRKMNLISCHGFKSLIAHEIMFQKVFFVLLLVLFSAQHHN